MIFMLAVVIAFSLFPGTLTRDPGYFCYQARIFENVARNINNKLGLSFLFFLLSNA